MATVRFTIPPERIKDRPSTIYLAVTIKGIRFRLSTGHKWRGDNWDQKEGRPIGRGNEATTLKAILDNLKGKVNQLLARNDIEGLVTTRDQIANLITYQLQAEPEVPEVNLWDLWADMIKAKVDTGNDAKSTIQQHKNTRVLFKGYEVKRKAPITYANLNKDLIAEYVIYLRKQGKQDSTISKEVKNLKVFAKYADEAGKLPAPDYEKWAKPTIVKTEVFALTEADLVAISQAPLNTSTLNDARDLFLLQCYTGQRYSDIMGLRPEQIGADYIKIVTQKTKDPLKIPITIEARSILDRYQGRPLPNLANPTINKCLKEIGKAAGLTQIEEDVTYKGNQRITKQYARYEKIVTHTARRTFVTRALAKGITIPMIMMWTGHKSIKTLAQYIGISEADLLASAEAFTQK
jgi:integrase